MNRDFDTPAVIVLYDVAKQNVVKMIDELGRAGIRHRPHIKVHKSVMMAKMQLACGAEGVTCAKISEAEVMVEGGITDILVANQIIGDIKLKRLTALCRRASIIVAVDSVDGAEQLSLGAQAADLSIKVYLEINIGADRCGVKPGRALELATLITQMTGLELVGLMTYSGSIYGKSKTEMPVETHQEPEILIGVQSELRAHGIDLPILSAGSSFSSRFPQSLKGITESRAGNYIYNDCTTLFSGLCTVKDCALRVVSTIISIPEEGRLIIDAGSKTLTSDTCSYRPGFGYVIEYPDMEIYMLNEEHGYVRYKDTTGLHIGQQLTIIPNHACVVPNVNEEIIGLSAERGMFVIPVEARGKNR